LQCFKCNLRHYDSDIIGEHEGFIAPPPFGILHMDTMKIYNSRVRGDEEKLKMRSLFGISIILGMGALHFPPSFQLNLITLKAV